MGKPNTANTPTWLVTTLTARSYPLANAHLWTPLILGVRHSFRAAMTMSMSPYYRRAALIIRNVWSCVPASLYCNVIAARKVFND